MKAVYLAPLALLLTGCSSILEGTWEAQPSISDSGGWRRDETLIQLDRVAMKGNLHRFNADTDRGWGRTRSWDDAGFQLDVRGRGQGIVMAMVTVDNLALDDLEAGMRVVENRSDAPDAPDLRGVGCGGEKNNQWETDVDATDLVLDVTEVTEDVVTIRLQGIFGHSGRDTFDTTVQLPLD
ncbi:MAG: hypothetical protein AAFV53_17555 [Myxococcota bacterium]